LAGDVDVGVQQREQSLQLPIVDIDRRVEDRQFVPMPFSSAEYGRWHDPCPPTVHRWVVARYSDALVQAVSGTAQADTASFFSDAEYAMPPPEGRRVAHEPGIHPLWVGTLPSG
jgi:hypothetical protein